MHFKEIVLVQTLNCAVCGIQENIINNAIRNRNGIIFSCCEYNSLKDAYKQQIKITDFPCTIIVKDNIVLHSFIGTMPIKEFNELLIKLNY